MGIVVPHPTRIDGSIRMVGQKQKELAEQLDRSIEAIYRIMRPLNTISSLDESIDLTPIIAAYQHIVDELAAIDPRHPPDRTLIESLVLKLKTLAEETLDVFCVQRRRGRNENVGRSLLFGEVHGAVIQR
ncbi:MAG: hypothetical protein ACOY3L_09380 [Pseudomonadota bacterium]